MLVNDIGRGFFMRSVQVCCLGLVLMAGSLLPVQAQSSREAAALSLRIGRLEDVLRQFTGRFEQLNHRLDVLEKRFNAFAEDTEFRFQDLKGGKRKGKRKKGKRKTTRSAPLRNPAPARRQPAQPEMTDTRDSTVRTLGTLPAGGLDLSLPGDASGGIDSMTAPADTAPPPMDARSQYDQAYGLLLRRNYAGAEQAFRAFLAAHGKSKLAGNAQYWLGESYYARRQYRKAADEFLKGYTRYKRSGKAPSSLLKLAMTLQRLGQRDAACTSFAELKRTFPRLSKSLKKKARAEERRAGC
jgi:tol-pal system protein YbgF